MDDFHNPAVMEKLKGQLEQKSASDLTLDEKLSLEHIRLHEAHSGHDNMHLRMVVVLVSTLVFAQVLLFIWKKCHFKSYRSASLIGLWLIPVIVCLKNQWWRFVSVWVFFTTITAVIFKKSLQRPIDRTIPRLVYYWFYGIHRVSYAAGVIGYTFLIASFFGANFCLGLISDSVMEQGGMFVCYGLYFGVLGRDVAEICSDRMTAQMGYCSTSSMPTRALRKNICAVCGNEMTGTRGNWMRREKIYKLNCCHKFHEFCIRGWCIVGKKHICPCCREKVDLQEIFKNPWEKTYLMYTQLLDFIGYIISWQPLIFSVAQIINSLLGLQ